MRQSVWPRGAPQRSRAAPPERALPPSAAQALPQVVARCEPATFAFLVRSLDAGLKSLDVSISSQCAAAVDNLAGFFFKGCAAGEAPSPAAQARQNPTLLKLYPNLRSRTHPAGLGRPGYGAAGLRRSRAARLRSATSRGRGDGAARGCSAPWRPSGAEWSRQRACRSHKPAAWSAPARMRSSECTRRMRSLPSTLRKATLPQPRTCSAPGAGWGAERGRARR